MVRVLVVYFFIQTIIIYCFQCTNIENLTEFKRVSAGYIGELFSFCLNIICTAVFEFVREIRMFQNVWFVCICDYRH